MKTIPTINFFFDLLIGGERYGLFVDILGFQINSSLNTVLPTFSCTSYDESKLFSHTQPFDDGVSQYELRLNKNTLPEEATTYIFKALRRKLIDSEYVQVSGTLESGDFLTRRRVKSYSTQTVAQIIEEIGLSAGFDEVRVSPEYEYTKTLIQPYCSDFEFLYYLKNNLATMSEDGGAFFYVTCEENKRILNFRSLTDLLLQPSKCSFINQANLMFDNESDKMFYPFTRYGLDEHKGPIHAMGAAKQPYRYFDYETGEYKNEVLLLKGNEQITDDAITTAYYYAVDEMESDTGRSYIYSGRTTEHFPTYKERAKNVFSKRILGLNQMSLTTMGCNDLNVGDSVNVIFADAPSETGIALYSGKWLVNSITHSIGRTFTTTLMLIRSGVHTDLNTTSYVKAGINSA